MTDLPPGWERVRLDEIAEVRLGRQRSPKNHTGTQMRPYIRAANVDWDGLKLDDVKQMNFTDQEAESYRLQPGDIVVGEASGSAGEVGKPALWNGEIDDCCFQNTLIRVRARGPDPKFLVYLLRYDAIRGAFVEHSRGVGIHHLGSARLAAWSIHLPPLAEQRRIVATLEGHLSRLRAAEDSLRRALIRASALRRNSLQELVEPGEAWSHVSLGEIADSVRNGVFVSRPGRTPDGVPILRIGSVRALELDLSDFRYSEKSASELGEAGFLIRPGDLLFTRYNGNPAYVGACAVVPDGIGPVTYPDKLIRVSIDSSRVLSDFVAMACSTGLSRRAINSCVKTTAGQAGISGRELKRIPISFPSLEDQKHRVAAFQAQNQSTQRLEEAVNSMLGQAEFLRRSLLAEAFAGRLVVQDPNDEPASDLVARVRTLREQQPAMQRRSRRSSRMSTDASRTTTSASVQEENPL